MLCVQSFIDAGRRPQFSGNTLILRNGNRFVHLSDESGNPTSAGHEFEQHTGEQLPASGYQQQRPRREGNTETIMLRNGKRAVSRRWDAAQNKWIFTKAGTEFYKRLRRNFVIQIPVTIKGVRKDRSVYSIKGLLPIDNIRHYSSSNGYRRRHADSQQKGQSINSGPTSIRQ